MVAVSFRRVISRIADHGNLLHGDGQRFCPGLERSRRHSVRGGTHRGTLPPRVRSRIEQLTRVAKHLRNETTMNIHSIFYCNNGVGACRFEWFIRHCYLVPTHLFRSLVTFM